MDARLILRINNLVFILCIAISCGPSKINRNVYEVSSRSSISKEAKVVKVHMNNGDLIILSKWSFDNNNHVLHGTGSHYDASRNELSVDKDYSIELEEIALFETNSIDNDGGQTGQTITMAGFSLLNFLVTVPCMADPKACFGSCPTYYAYNGKEMSLQGEGFSSSMAKTYESQDLDMLFDVVNDSDTFMLEIRNEALETHMIRYCDLIVLPRYPTERIYASQNGTFYASSRTVEPEKCSAAEGDILQKIIEYDEIERYSAADSTNLISKESVEITFPNDKKKYGLVITSRQTLMTTFLFYQTMAYFGSTLPYWTSKLESGNEGIKNRGLKMYGKLGGIEVLIKKGNKWKKIGEIDEMGPIASDFHLIELPEMSAEKLDIRLRMTKGLWRIDYISLVELGSKVEPIRIQPFQVQNKNTEPTNYATILNDSSKYLVTLPGERYMAYYMLPEEELQFEYYLLSKGYYLEWMREEWLEEENRQMISTLFLRPNKYLKEMAPKFKKVEPFIDNIFWNTKIQTH